MLVSINDFMPLILSMLVLLVLFIVIAVICALLLRRIFPASFNRFLIGACSLLGLYIWVFPMNMGFYEFFRSIF